jgi:predicted Zn-ribbon and HTH transcriptional regulator
MSKEMCGNKKPYQTFKHAEYDSRDIRRKYNEVSVPYHCRHCGFFHVGEPLTKRQGRKNAA